MTTQLHIRLNKQLLRWVFKKAKIENRSVNNFIVTILIKLKEEENANLGTKDSR